MNRYNRGPTIGGPSKATASTTCQKCLKKDIYECKTIIQERPYVARPSRTQQLQNPKLVPKLASDVPEDLLRKKGIADEQLAKLEEERGRKHDRESEEPEVRGASKRMRSASSASSASVSTISTNMSRSPSPQPRARNSAGSKIFYASLSHSPPSRDTGISIPARVSQSPPRQRLTDSERKRRRDSFSSADSYNSEVGRSSMRGSRERASSRSTRRKYKELSPPMRGRRTESRSPPVRGRRTESRSSQRDRRRELSKDRRRIDDWEKPNLRNGRRPPENAAREIRSAPRERSLSPFSKRLALTQAMNR